METNNKSVAVVWGAGSIGTALVNRIQVSGKYDRVVLVSRRSFELGIEGVQTIQADMLDEASLEAAFDALVNIGVVRLMVVATGMLHDAEVEPEKTARQISLDTFQKTLTVNTIGPALIAKYFANRMPRKGRVVFAAISARVGSISDNKLGGWYSYRASKAALNMLLKTLSIEWQRRNPNTLCIGLHPGTVNTELSAPFQKGVRPGKLFTPDYAAERLFDVVETKSATESGFVFAFDGTKVPE